MKTTWLFVWGSNLAAVSTERTGYREALNLEFFLEKKFSEREVSVGGGTKCGLRGGVG